MLIIMLLQYQKFSYMQKCYTHLFLFMYTIQPKQFLYFMTT